MLKKARRILLKHYCLLSIIVLISAAFILGPGAVPAKAAAAATGQTQATQQGIKAPAKPIAAAPAKPAPGTKININTADKATLEKIPEIGPVKAQAIIDGRPYKAVEDVMRVKGIKGKTFEFIRDYIAVK